MKIAFEGLDLPEGKTKYNDPIVIALAEKYQPLKVSPYYFEFVRGAFDTAEAIILAGDRVLDLLILDMEKFETRRERSEDEQERDLLQRCLAQLEDGIPLCDAALNDAERQALRALGTLSLKPTLLIEDAQVDPDAVCEPLLCKAGKMFFYTTGKQEVHAWLVRAGADAVTCAGRIHNDLARGFIKAEIVSFDDLMTTHNLQSARAEGLTRLVDRDYPIPQRTVIDIRFNV